MPTPKPVYTPPSVSLDPRPKRKRGGSNRGRRQHALDLWFQPPRAPAPGRGPGRGPAGPPRTPPPLGPDPSEADADRIISELLAELGLSRDSARREAERAAQGEITRAQQLSQALAALGMPQAIQGIYQNSGQSLAGLAQGFSGELQGQASAQAAEMANMLGGQTAGVRNEGVGMGDVLYGTQGFIPARGLEQTGAAFASQAALQPGFALQFGQEAAAEQMQRFIEEVLPEFTAKEAEIRTKRPSLVAEARDRRRAEAKEMYSAGFMTTRDFAKAMGVKNWRKYPNTLPSEEAERPKASASLSEKVGYLVDEYGEPILNSKGKPIPLPKDPAKADRFGSAESGYWAWNPETGEIVNLLPPQGPKPTKPPNLQTKNINGRTFVFDPQTGGFYDPATGRQVNPNAGGRGGGGGGGGKPPSRETMQDGWDLVKSGKQGWWALQGNPTEPVSSSELRQILKDAGMSVADLPTLTPEQEDQLGISYYYSKPDEVYLDLVRMGIAPARARSMVRKSWPNWGRKPPPAQAPYQDARPPQYGPGGSYGPKGDAPSGGRYNASFVQAAGFSADSGVVNTIMAAAQRYRVDPFAVMAVALAEGGLRYGAVGDNGTSYGPFQLHRGGALPKGKSAAWANSPAGINYAVRKIGQVARGLSGQAAIDAIVRRFERPADPDSEITRASGYYQQLTNAPRGATGGAVPVSYTPGRVSGAAGSVINAALTQIGKPYVFGSGPDTSSFDCSDLVQWAYKQVGVNIPRVTHDQIKVGQPVRWGQFQPGDLIFTNKGGHVMLYIGNGKMISAPYTGSTVKIVDVSGYKNSFYAARRILPGGMRI